MFDVGATELLVIVVVAIIVIGPKDLPLAMRTAGRWIGKMRRISGHFRAGVDAMIREAEMEEMEREWRDRNARIMRSHPGDAAPARLAEPHDGSSAQAAPASAEAHVATDAKAVPPDGGSDHEVPGPPLGHASEKSAS